MGRKISFSIILVRCHDDSLHLKEMTEFDFARLLSTCFSLKHIFVPWVTLLLI